MEELKIVRNLLNKLNKNIEYCHWKSNQHFDKALIGVDDLDILINKDQKNNLLQILSELNFKHFYTPTTRSYVGIEDWLGFDTETGIIIHLHLHYNLIVGEKHLKGFHLPFEKSILSNRRYDENQKVYMSAYHDEMLLLILRLGMKNRKRDFIKGNVFEKSTYDEFNWLKDNCQNFIKIINNNEILTTRLKKVIIEIYKGDFKWTTMNKLKRYLYKDFKCYSQGNSLHNTLKRHLHEINRIRLEIKKRYIKSKYTFLRRRSSSGGRIIAILGSDGAGKSSSIKEIESWLKKVIDIRYFYLGSGDGNSSILRMPLKLAKKLAQKLGLIKTTNNFSTSKLNDKENSYNKPLGFARKLWIYTLSKERIRKLIKANRCKIHGYTVITDRFPQSEFAGLCDGPKLCNKQGIVANIEKESFRIAKMCAPDLAIKLIVSPEVAIKRKPNEIELETSKNLTERVKKIKFSDYTKEVLINADKPQKEVILDIKRAIWNEL